MPRAYASSFVLGADGQAAVRGRRADTPPRRRSLRRTGRILSIAAAMVAAVLAGFSGLGPRPQSQDRLFLAVDDVPGRPADDDEHLDTEFHTDRSDEVRADSSGRLPIDGPPAKAGADGELQHVLFGSLGWGIGRLFRLLGSLVYYVVYGAGYVVLKVGDTLAGGIGSFLAGMFRGARNGPIQATA
eukprot:TRINITY_DN45119_c0_g1_i1.p1 TRINITY_DN45119_c0_g1~~TRINITY_DN45119_c0_g1_i1.p1  ORF type:complete len:213 (-),score=5.64 TRINITY_DN45119_c0_g1_i1:675-1232(-)